MSTVFISGANGYIAQHIVKTFLSRGHRVVGSVRSAAKGQHLKKLFQSDFEYAVVPDIQSSGAFSSVFSRHPNISVVIHSAAPSYHQGPKLQESIIDPMVNGTNALLEAAWDHEPVRKFVLTSSYGTMGMSRMLQPKSAPNETITEESWTYTNKESATTKGPMVATMCGKVFSEQAAWEFLKRDMPQFELASINPAFVFGPQAFDSEVKLVMNGSVEMLHQFLKGKSSDRMPTLVPGSFYDVRDVAEAHYFAATSNKADSQRLLLANGQFSSQQIANILRDNFPQLRDVVPEGNPQKIPKVKCPYDDSHTRALFQHEPIGLEQSVVDTVAQIIAAKQA
ncbi:dihydroflavonol-4-reductase [Suhomyces tanzawaensis NRRL Y-17324]|uniref:Dihydroflavonol-4-reductase n=1 Tax=Suhomyces tanzawaensis NRRL Y-17324 TaxID=984487 RepID=A0A1E4SHH6_9ASCO|nr:dihydroflavonol-4-reductase [Suhomyces tanzawaensis NRRL Y-17324]ODV78935.1 dihydroflavonol-4-reductase [Suhomyces tanzawaensis NRRL Y-17324]